MLEKSNLVKLITTCMIEFFTSREKESNNVECGFLLISQEFLERGGSWEYRFHLETKNEAPVSYKFMCRMCTFGGFNKKMKKICYLNDTGIVLLASVTNETKENAAILSVACMQSLYNVTHNFPSENNLFTLETDSIIATEVNISRWFTVKNQANANN